MKSRIDETYTPRPFRGRGEQGATGNRFAQSEDVKSSSRSMVTPRNSPFRKIHSAAGITDQPTSIVLPRSGSGERTPENLGSNDVPAQMNAGQVRVSRLKLGSV